jgi:hypothetical protein
VRGRGISFGGFIKLSSFAFDQRLQVLGCGFELFLGQAHDHRVLNLSLAVQAVHRSDPSELQSGFGDNRQRIDRE